MTPVPVSLLTIAGFDPSSGAGITADLKVFAAQGAYGLACPTAWTVQSTQGVRRISAANPALVRDTLDCLSDDIAIAGVKIGMLADRAVLSAVLGWLSAFRSAQPNVPVVLDPVLRSSSGYPLLVDDALLLFRDELLPLLSVITPNLAEAAVLAEQALDSVSSSAWVEDVARTIRSRMNPAGAVIVTGGHLRAPDGRSTPNDLLLGPDDRLTWIAGEWVETSSTHGTGCAFSSALLARIAQGATLNTAAREAKRYVEGALRAAYPVGKGRGPMHHLHTLEP
jgi:hydroxymethylpyrimidine/phosphomethylpyrimidine kinase